MAMTIVEADRPVTGGVDTHLDVHVAATLDSIGGLLGVESFTASADGYRKLFSWMSSFGPVTPSGWRARAPTAPDWPATCTTLGLR